MPETCTIACNFGVQNESITFNVNIQNIMLGTKHACRKKFLGLHCNPPAKSRDVFVEHKNKKCLLFGYTLTTESV